MSEADSDDSGVDSEDFLSEFEDGTDDFSSQLVGYRSPIRSSHRADAASPSESQENWHMVGQRLSAVILALNGESDQEFEYPPFAGCQRGDAVDSLNLPISMHAACRI